MIQDLANKVWANPRFHRAAKAVEKNWLRTELALNDQLAISDRAAARAISAAAILACSNKLEHRIAALRLSTYVFETAQSSDLPLDAALRIVLTRLGNFPSLQTRSSVQNALPVLPWVFAAEELAAIDQRSVKVGDRTEVLTDFQHSLWRDLRSKNSVAFSAPTSGGKSFVLELYLASLFDAQTRSVVYLVPSRALINQVTAELNSLFRNHERIAPEIVSVPLRAEVEAPHRAIYVMTQERMHLSLQSHPEFSADVIVVDEAQSISEGARGILLQTVIEELLTRNPNSQILFASPTTRNLDAFGRLFRPVSIAELPSREPTVSQNFLILHSSDSKVGKITITAARENGRSTALGESHTRLRLRTRIDKLAHIPLALCKNQSNIIYANGADEAEDIALHLSKQIDLGNPSQKLLALSRLARESVHSKFVLAECVEKGVGFHYANIPTNLRQEIESAFAEGELKYLVCTSTLLQGVNLPAKNIFMLKPTRGQGKPIESADFWNLAGRAGRLRREFQGNIFLIDYESWQSQPLREPKDTNISPAIEKSIKYSTSDLENILQGKAIRASKSKKVELESASIRLFSDFRNHRLDETLSRLNLTDQERGALRAQLESVQEQITLPTETLKRSHNVSPHKQQKLYRRLKETIDAGPDDVNSLIPLHPRDRGSYESYANALALCHEIISGIDTSRKLHRFHALLAQRWMLGWSVPRLISAQIKRAKKKEKEPDLRKIIRETLQLIEEVIRFQTIRYFNCYNAVLEHVLSERGAGELGKQIPDVQLFLEIGASDQTMVSLISLGLSRAVAIRLNGARFSTEPQLGIQEALAWLRSQSGDLQSLGLSQLQIDEVNELLSNTRFKGQQ